MKIYQVKLLVLLSTVGFFLVMNVWPSEIWAEDGQVPPKDGEATSSGEISIYTPRILPDSPLYFVKKIKEKIELLTAFTPEAQADKYTEMATRRIAEARIMTKKGKFELIEELMEKHRDHLKKAEERIEIIEDEEKSRGVLERLALATSIHLEVLADIYEEAPESTRMVIKRAIEATFELLERVLKVVSREKGEAWLEEAKRAIQKEGEAVKKTFWERIKEWRPGGCICLKIWEPVCGIDGITYANECRLKCARVEKAFDGECFLGEEW